MSNVPEPKSVLIPELPKGWNLLSYKVLADNRLAIIGTDLNLPKIRNSNRERVLQLSAKASAKIWVFDGDNSHIAISFQLLEPYSIIDRFPDGGWLVSNTISNENGNTRILRPDGTEERRIELGTHIRHIKIDDSGLIWVGWGDQGIFGNDNWSVPELKEPPSSKGIAAFDSRGTLIKSAAIGTIAECYALNIFNDEAWSCTYMDFPIWQMKNDRQKIWPSDLLGTKAIAVSYPFVMAAGGYRGNVNRLVLLRLDKDQAQQLAQWRTTAISNVAIDQKMIDGRGKYLHAITGQIWHQWNVYQIATEFDS